MIVDRKGRRINNTHTDKLVIYVSNDEGASWRPLKTSDVPDWLKEQDILGRLVDGEMCRIGESPWYRAEKFVKPTGIIH